MHPSRQARMGNMQASATPLMYAIQDVPGKGKGLIAARDIPKGARIIFEKPIFAVGEPVESELAERVTSLDQHQRGEFLSMSNIHPFNDHLAQWVGILYTNALPVGSKLELSGIFLTACRINHACDNNAAHCWHDDCNRLTVHAIRGISKGEEITISYLGGAFDRNERQEELQRRFHFTCTCQLCSLLSQQSIESDLILNRINEIDNIISDEAVLGPRGINETPENLLCLIEEMVQLCKRHDHSPNPVGLAHAYYLAFQITKARGDFARARVFADRLVPVRTTFMGKESRHVSEHRRLRHDPTVYKFSGVSMQGLTNLDEVPFGPWWHDLEAWLWMRDLEIDEGVNVQDWLDDVS